MLIKKIILFTSIIYCYNSFAIEDQIAKEYTTPPKAEGALSTTAIQPLKPPTPAQQPSNPPASIKKT